jgi:uncharacterized protein YaeQ
MYVFTVRIADADRNVYESLTLRVAQHPSEAAEYLVTRVLAYCLEYAEGITFSKGLSDPEEPTIGIRDLTGVLQSWRHWVMTIAQGVTMKRPEPIREIAPPAWPLPLISSLPRGPRRN